MTASEDTDGGEEGSLQQMTYLVILITVAKDFHLNKYVCQHIYSVCNKFNE